MNLILKFDGGSAEAIAGVSRAKVENYKLFIKYLDGKKEIIKIFDKQQNGDIATVSSVYADTSLMWHLYDLEHERNLLAIEEEDKRGE